MYCENCGAKIPDDAVFCEECGARVSRDDIKEKNSDYDHQKIEKKEVINENNEVIKIAKYDDKKIAHKDKDSTKIIYTIGIVGISCLLIIGGFVIHSKLKKKNKGTNMAKSQTEETQESVITESEPTEKATEVITEKKEITEKPTETVTEKQTEKVTEKKTEKKKKMKKAYIIPVMTDIYEGYPIYYDANMISSVTGDKTTVVTFNGKEGNGVDVALYASEVSYIFNDLDIGYDYCEDYRSSDISGHDTYVIPGTQTLYDDTCITWEVTAVYFSRMNMSMKFTYCYTSEEDLNKVNKYIKMLVDGFDKGSKSGGTVNYSDYILPDSSSRYLEESDLEGLSKDMLSKARNEIYARHGRLFSNPDLQSYFNSKSWYSGTINPNDFDQSCLNEYEKYNANFILQYENR